MGISNSWVCIKCYELFQSSASAEITMYKSHIGPVLENSKKRRKGVITVAELPFLFRLSKQSCKKIANNEQEIEIDEDELMRLKKKAS